MVLFIMKLLKRLPTNHKDACDGGFEPVSGADKVVLRDAYDLRLMLVPCVHLCRLPVLGEVNG